MSKLVPVGDVFMIEVAGKDTNPLGLVGMANPEEGVREGIVVGISDQLAYYGMNTFAFDKSLMDLPMLKEIYNHYKQYLGKRVYWSERSEAGSIINYGDATYAFVKWSAIMGVLEE